MVIMEIKSPYKIIKVVSEKRSEKYGYIRRVELVSMSDYGDLNPLEMINYYSLDSGDWIGGEDMALYLCEEKGIRDIQLAAKDHTVCSIGFNRTEKKWYGWSHRAVVGFGIGDKLFEEDYGDDDTLYIEHGNKTIETLDEAKQSAIKFAEYVS